MAAPLETRTFLEAATLHPPTPKVRYAYGTAGFRTKAHVLDSVLFRVGTLAALRSMKLNGQTIGVMVTASHNPEEDNGVKLVDPRGEMLHAAWEKHATALANAGDQHGLLEVTKSIIDLENIDLSVAPAVVYGYDTRPSCPALIAALEDGLRCFSSKRYICAGLQTTPQLHYMVRCLNEDGKQQKYGEPSEAGYYDKMATAFKKLNSGKEPLSALTVDCANGVGAPKLKAFLSYLEGAPLQIIVRGDSLGVPGTLNVDCGADYVKTRQRPPKSLELQLLSRYCSFDGDADRLVYYYADIHGTFQLLDGDKIACLAAAFLRDLVEASGVKAALGVVQTAYANGSSTRYLTEVLKVPVTCTPTGVKYLHHAAEAYEIGVYFEANGHGTILFAPAFINRLQQHQPSSEAQSVAIIQLLALHDLINQTVGDALSDLLFVETVLLHKRWNPADWDSAYTDLPNRLVKVLVGDRFAFKTEDAERRLSDPAGLQARLDDLARTFPLGRTFVRPSGTEDCVRVYAEAAQREQTDELAFKVAGIVFDAAGTGPKPADFL